MLCVLGSGQPTQLLALAFHVLMFNVIIDSPMSVLRPSSDNRCISIPFFYELRLQHHNCFARNHNNYRFLSENCLLEWLPVKNTRSDSLNRQRRRHCLMLALRTPESTWWTQHDSIVFPSPIRFTWCATVQIHFEASLMCCESSRHVNLSIAFCSLHFRFCFSLRSQTAACAGSCTNHKRQFSVEEMNGNMR